MSVRYLDLLLLLTICPTLHYIFLLHCMYVIGTENSQLIVL